jgi:hypothetical protein
LLAEHCGGKEDSDERALQILVMEDTAPCEDTERRKLCASLFITFAAFRLYGFE